MALWDKIASRGNVEDRRGAGPMLIGGGGVGITGLALFLLLTYLQGGDITDVITTGLQQVQVSEQNIDPAQFEGADEYETFASAVLGSSDDMWSEIFRQSNSTYNPPTLVLFRGATQSACGGASSQVGPHYCPLNETIYLDETFFNELQSRFGATGGDVAEAYVIAHEAGHNEQNKLGIMDEINRYAGSSRENELSVKLELQADCFAGLWAYSIRDLGVIQPGEIKEAMDAAAAVGDDRIQETTTGRVNPESWTHGSSEERVAWFTRGYESGELSSCNTFGT